MADAIEKKHGGNIARGKGLIKTKVEDEGDSVQREED